MLLPKDKFINTPIMSLQTGGQLGIVSDLLVDPRNLSVIALIVSGQNLVDNPSYLMTIDIREMGPMGIIVDSSDVLFPAEDVIRIQEVVDFGFDINNIKVKDQKGTLIGKVIDYTLDSLDQKIQQLTVKSSLMRRLTIPEVLIHRSQILDITNEEIIIKSSTEKNPMRTQAAVSAVQPGNYVNPFRSTESTTAVNNSPQDN